MHTYRMLMIFALRGRPGMFCQKHIILKGLTQKVGPLYFADHRFAGRRPIISASGAGG
jgi:hypothetical protein